MTSLAERPAPTAAVRILTERDGSVGIVTMNRPETFNSLDPEMAQDLRKACLRFARDEDVRCIVLRGLPRVFCSGADLRYVQRQGEEQDLGYLRPRSSPVQTGYGASFKQILEYIHSTISEIRRAPKPVIASVSGVAAAGGFGLAMACDLVFAAQDAGFEWAYQKTALTGAESSTFFLPRLLGPRKAMELLFLNPRIDAAEALQLGLITRVYPADILEAEVIGVAHALASGPTASFAVAKSLINEAAGVDRLDYHLDRELTNLARIAGTPDFAEGLDAFFAHREPRFTGKSRPTIDTEGATQ